MRRLLIVAEEHQVRELMAFTLGLHGFSVHTARGAAALEALTELDPDLVLIDLSLDPPGGLAAARAMRARALCPPLVILSSFPGGEQEAAGRALSDAFLLKPCRPSQLLDTVYDLLPPGELRSTGSLHWR